MFLNILSLIKSFESFEKREKRENDREEVQTLRGDPRFIKWLTSLGKVGQSILYLMGDTMLFYRICTQTKNTILFYNIQE